MFSYVRAKIADKGFKLRFIFIYLFLLAGVRISLCFDIKKLEPVENNRLFVFVIFKILFVCYVLFINRNNILKYVFSGFYILLSGVCIGLTAFFYYSFFGLMKSLKYCAFVSFLFIPVLMLLMSSVLNEDEKNSKQICLISVSLLILLEIIKNYL